METINVTFPKLPEPKVYFIASLSNGEVCAEGKDKYKWIDGQKTPWNRLVRYAVENNLTITSVSLFTVSGATHSLPPLGKARFRGYNDKQLLRPLDYEVKRLLARDINGSYEGNVGKVEGVEIAEFYTILEAIYKDFIVEVWVSELDTRHSWTVIKGKK